MKEEDLKADFCMYIILTSDEICIHVQSSISLVSRVACRFFCDREYKMKRRYGNEKTYSSLGTWRHD